MSGTIDAYSDWDAAYVLGSLSAKDRLEFEQHLAGCPQCSASVAELAVLPGLLSKVPGGDVSDGAPDVPDLLPKLAHAAARRRRRDRLITASAIAVAAAVAAVLALVLPLALVPAAPVAAQEVTLGQVVASSLHADVRLFSVGWGTDIRMTCQYAPHSEDYSPQAAEYAMFVTDDTGSSSQIATWRSKPGSTVRLSGATGLPVDAIRSIQVRSVTSGRVLLEGTLSG
jgi:hypothetical protein